MIDFVRRQPTRWVWPLFVVADLAFIFSRGGQFRGYWLSTADWTAGTVILTGPLATAVGAWAARFQLKHMREASILARRGARSVTTVIKGQLGLLLAAQLVGVLVAVVYTATANPHPDALLHFVPQFFILAGFLSAGVAVGFALPTPYTAPLAGVAAFAVQLPAVGVLPRALVKFGGATANLVGLRAHPSFDLAHIAFGIGLVLLVSAGAAWLVTRTRPSAIVLGVGVIGVVLAAGSSAFLMTTTQERFDVPRTVSVRCSDVAPVDVCLPADVETLRGRVTSVVSSVDAEFRRLGVTQLPSRVVLVPAGATPGAYVAGATTRPIVLQGDDINGASAEQYKALLPYLIVDRRCLDARANTDLTVPVADLQTAGDWVLLDLAADPTTAALPEVRTLKSWPTARAEAWVREVLIAANTCRLGDMPHPVS